MTSTEREEESIYESLSWAPLSTMDGAFGARKLVKVSNTQLKLKATPMALAFCSVILALGMYMLYTEFNIPDDVQREPVMRSLGIISGLFITMSGSTMFFLSCRTVLFDRERASYTKKRMFKGTQVPFSQIHAVQLLKKRSSDTDGDHLFSFELNIVQNSGSRMHVVSYRERSDALIDAEQLAQFMRVKLWSKLN